MIKELGNASLLVFLAEMGDKTQILAMAFALKYSVGQVLTGVAFGSLCNHGLAVFIGVYLGHLIPLQTMRITAGFLFLFFGLWSLIPEKEGSGQNGRISDYPILTVAFAFFVGELGDKTQLTAITLASNANFPWAVLGGTVLGMVLTSCVGIVIGAKLGDRVPELALKIISSGVFIGFGLYQLWTTVPTRLLSLQYVTAFLLLLALAVLILIIPPFYRRKKNGLKRVAGDLKALNYFLDILCLGEEKCVHCRKVRCPVGYCKSLVKKQLAGGELSLNAKPKIEPYRKSGQLFDQGELRCALKLLEKGNLAVELSAELRSNLEKMANYHR